MKKAFKIIIWIIVVLFIMACIIFALIPAFLSSRNGTASIVSSLEETYGGKYVIQRLELKWYGLQRAGNIKVMRDKKIITAEEASIRMSLFRLFLLRKYPLEIVFSGEMHIKNAKILLGDNTSLTNVNFIANNQDRSMKITGNTQIEGASNGSFTAEGTEGTPWNWDGTLTNFPSRVVELFFPKFPARAVIGPGFQSTFKFDNKQLTLDFDSPKLQFSTEGILNGTMFLLGKQTKIDYILDKTASNAIFKDSSVKPISAELITATIEPTNTRFQYRPYKTNSIMISKMTLSPGKMIFRNFGTLSDLLSLIKLEYRQNKDVPVWFQEMPIAVTKGVASVTRSEILLDNSLQVALWGDVDFEKERVDAFIGITGQILRKVFNLKSIGPAYVIPAKVDGKFDNIRIHKSSVLRGVAKLVITEQANMPVRPMPTTKVPPNKRPVPWKKK